jgi:endonuclease/exonuclease/phosphatase family metal-dependent hydrolase
LPSPKCRPAAAPAQVRRAGLARLALAARGPGVLNYGMRRALPLLFVLLLYAACVRDKDRAPARIRVASYNMAILGPSKAAKPAVMGVLARIAAGFDLVAMQEVGSNASTASDEACAEAMDAFVAGADAVAGGDLFSYVRSGQYALLYRKDRLEVKSFEQYSGSRAFAYPPLVAYFQVRGRPLDFAMMTIHTRPSRASEEIPAIAVAMDEVAADLAEADVVCAGDFNADGEYYPEGDGQALAGFPAGRFLTVIPNEADTTVAKEALAYDRMELSSAMAGDYAGSWGVLRPGDSYDLSACEGPGGSAGTERALSDHYPIWAEFSTTADRD